MARSRLTVGRQAASVVLAGIIILAVALRVSSAIYQGDAIAALPGIHDQFSYDALARRVLAGHGFSFGADWWPLSRAGEPTAHWSYLYTLYLTAIYALFGPHPLAARLIQAVLAGILMPLLTYRIGCRVFGERVGLVAAGLTAIYAYFVYYAGALMTESFYIIAILWMLDVALRIGGSTNQQMGEWANREWIELGVALGVAALLRQVILLFVPFLFVWLWWATSRQGEWERGGQGESESLTPSPPHPLSLSPFLVSLAVIAAMIAPWTVRNYRVFDRFVLLNTNAGFAFFWANHPIYGTHFVAILPPEGPSYQDLIPPELRGLDEAALDQALLREGLRFVVEDPLRYALLSLSRIKDYFKFWPSSDSGPISNVARALSFGLLLPFMAYGLVLSVARSFGFAQDRRPWSAAGGRRHVVSSVEPSAVTLLYLFIGTYSLIHLLSWSLIRYRLPVDAALILFAGVGIVNLASRAWPTREVLMSGGPDGTKKEPEGPKGLEGPGEPKETPGSSVPFGTSGTPGTSIPWRGKND